MSASAAEAKDVGRCRCLQALKYNVAYGIKNASLDLY